MDLQMPEMDGYQATAKLRSDARFARLPIIAMTAHATIEERQRCLVAGMNDHIAKPIDPVNLLETVARFCKSADAAAADPNAGPLTDYRGAEDDHHDLPSIAGLDTRDGLLRVGGNRKLYLKLLGQFVEQQGPAVEQITDALAKGDIALAERLAHSLKGVSGNIGAPGIQSAAGVLERMIHDRADAKSVDAATRQVTAWLAPLVTQLRGALDLTAASAREPSTTAARATPAQSRAAAVQLTALLSELDPGAVDFLETNRADLRPLFGDGTWREFEALVQGYAFEEAQGQLSQALERFPLG
jgi:CheY-like chemotaxis protein